MLVIQLVWSLQPVAMYLILECESIYNVAVVHGALPASGALLLTTRSDQLFLITMTSTATARDLRVLDMVFDPESQTHQPENSLDHEVDMRTAPIPLVPIDILPVLKALESKAIKMADSNPKEAIQLLNTAIEKSHNLYASGFNNRAQCYRMINDSTNAMNDLNNAIHIAEGQLVTIVMSLPSPSSERDSNLLACKSVLAQAYTQRAVLHRFLGANGDIIRADFERGAKYGNGIAKRMAVAMNPVAKLCGDMVEQMMRTEQGV